MRHIDTGLTRWLAIVTPEDNQHVEYNVMVDAPEGAAAHAAWEACHQVYGHEAKCRPFAFIDGRWWFRVGHRSVSVLLQR